MKKSAFQTNWAVVSLLFFAASAWADGDGVVDATEREPAKFEFKPVVLDSEKTESSTLGVEYQFSDKLFTEEFDSVDDDDCKTLPCPKTILGAAKLAYDAKGVLTENADNNPKNFIEFNLTGQYLRTKTEGRTIWSGGLFLKYEADQTFDNKQTVYGLNGAFSMRDAIHLNDFAFVQFNIGSVDPADDTARQAILGENLDSYDRLDIELVYRFTINKGILDTFEVNYRYFKEINASSTIKDASLDDARLITYHIGFTNQMYIAYSSGELPFDQKDNQIFEVGYTYKFD